jgi:hypothetical protein
MSNVLERIDRFVKNPTLSSEQFQEALEIIIEAKNAVIEHVDVVLKQEDMLLDMQIEMQREISQGRINTAYANLRYAEAQLALLQLEHKTKFGKQEDKP